MLPGRDGRKGDFRNEESQSIENYFHELSGLITQLPYTAIKSIVSAFLDTFEHQRTVFVFGNGGSAASASHLMCDMNKGASGLDSNKRPRVISLTDNVPLMSAWANDFGYERIFSEQLKTFVKPRDIAFAISTSGDSPNVLLALETAREYGALTLGLAGCHGGQMKFLCDVCAVVPSDNAQVVEDLHQAMLHSIFNAVRESLQTETTRASLAKAASF
ncbi:MAG TPA: SIS domain-containing protein [Candidatus Angelobacter sp.]|jgi:D-sedoheptulose 7-phosphate isomerase